MRNSIILVLLAGAVLAGCSPHPEPAELLVDTVPPGASCLVARDGWAVGNVYPTPGIALLDDKNPSDAVIQCRRSGFAPVAAFARPHERESGFFSGGTRHYEFDNPVTLVLRPLAAAWR